MILNQLANLLGIQRPQQAPVKINPEKGAEVAQSLIQAEKPDPLPHAMIRNKEISRG